MMRELPTELLCYICESLSLTDLDALESAYEGYADDVIHDVIHDYIFRRGLNSIQNPLHELVEIKRIDCIEHLASYSGVNVNVRDQMGRTPLHVAAEDGDVAVIMAVLRFPNLNKDVLDRHAHSPLTLAIWNRHLAVVQLLLEEGAAHRGALSLAVKIGCVDLVTLLLSMEAIDVNETNDTNCSPLYLAAQYGRPAISRLLLLREDIIPELRDRRTLCTPFLIAAYGGQTAILLQLLSRGDVNVHTCDSEERTALSLAAEEGHLAVVGLLVGQGINPQRVDRFGRTCLHYAVVGEHQAVLELLLRTGGDCQIPDKTGMTPIRLAVRAKNKTMVEAMLRASNSINYEALLIAAAEYSNVWVAGKALRRASPNIEHKGTIPLLLSKKPAFIRFLLADPRINPNQTDWYGRTLLMQAVQKKWLSVVRILVSKNGLGVDQVDKGGQSALDYAKQLNLGRISNLLREYPRRRLELRNAWRQLATRKGET